MIINGIIYILDNVQSNDAVLLVMDSQACVYIFTIYSFVFISLTTLNIELSRYSSVVEPNVFHIQIPMPTKYNGINQHKAQIMFSHTLLTQSSEIEVSLLGAVPLEGPPLGPGAGATGALRVAVAGGPCRLLLYARPVHVKGVTLLTLQPRTALAVPEARPARPDTLHTLPLLLN